ncbi:MAG: hypothetical protein H6557_04675 [Lewinellaceae bacterium]|nr:hypothetical protein [Phaeodactylibacter sp.]MCB9035897.1 hypothetical protein [Lewinellaceae bacterium]
MTSSSAHTHSLLYTFFVNLKRAGFPVGITEYNLLLEMFRKGYIPADKSQLLRLCRLLWLKSEKDRADFEHIFYIAFGALPEELVEEKKAREIDRPPEQKEGLSNERSPEKGKEKPKEPFPKQEKEDLPEKPKPPPPVSDDEAASLRIQLQMEGELKKSDELEKGAREAFSLQRDYLPVTQREMTAVWRRLRNTHTPVYLEELDVDATVQEVCQTGFFTKPAFKHARQHNRLIILADCQGSMIAFEALGNRIVETARRLATHRQVERYYFHDIPGEKVFKDAAFFESQELYPLFSEVNTPFDALLIFGDAGAARGQRDNARIAKTADFLTKMKTMVRNIVWINPMPRHRWQGTPAALIARFVPMYSVEPKEIKQAILKLT